MTAAAGAWADSNECGNGVSWCLAVGGLTISERIQEST